MKLSVGIAKAMTKEGREGNQMEVYFPRLKGIQ
jgi:hypothetical protein